MKGNFKNILFQILVSQLLLLGNSNAETLNCGQSSSYHFPEISSEGKGQAQSGPLKFAPRDAAITAAKQDCQANLRLKMLEQIIFQRSLACSAEECPPGHGCEMYSNHPTLRGGIDDQNVNWSNPSVTSEIGIFGNTYTATITCTLPANDWEWGCTSCALRKSGITGDPIAFCTDN